MKLIDSYKESLRLLKEFVENEKKENKTEEISKIMSELFYNGNKILIAGNGGSNCDAIHFAEEFTGKFRDSRRALPVISLSDSSHITCVGNDFGFDYIFSRGVEAYGKPGDMFIGLSTSGNSSNIIEAVKSAKKIGMKTFVLLGKDGGKLKGICDYEFIIPGETSDRIQELHMTILHILIEGTEKIMFPENYSLK